jgi:hypothetical protein
MQSIAEILPRTTNRTAASDRVQAVLVIRAAKEVLSEELGREVAVRSFRDGIVNVVGGFDDLRAELFRRQAELVSKLNDRIGSQQVCRIRTTG